MKNTKNIYTTLAPSKDSSEFSFSKGFDAISSGKSVTSLKNDLNLLEKIQIIELLIEEIEENKVLKFKTTTLEEQLKLINSFRDDSYESSKRGRFPLAQRDTNKRQMCGQMEDKYRELTQYMEEYIINTNEAQTQMLTVIQQLKTENRKLNEEIRKTKQMRREEQYGNIVKKLEESLSHYISINNENTNKYEKLKKMYEIKEDQVKNLAFKLQKEKEGSFCEKVKMLEVQNHELKEILYQYEGVLEKKSEKIRRLLEEMEKISEERWNYKEMIMEMKAKQKVYESTDVKDSFSNSNSDKVKEHGSVSKFM